MDDETGQTPGRAAGGGAQSLSGCGAPPDKSYLAGSRLHEHAGAESPWIESAARWLQFHMARFSEMWWEDRYVSPDPLEWQSGDQRPTLDDLQEAVAQLHEDTVELVRCLGRAGRHTSHGQPCQPW